MAVKELNMTQEEMQGFVKAVREMRTWQTAYFKTRNPTAMNEAKRCERTVDRMLSSIESQDLFGQ